MHRRLIAAAPALSYLVLSRAIIVPGILVPDPGYSFAVDAYIGFIPIHSIYVLTQPVFAAVLYRAAVVVDLLVLVNTLLLVLLALSPRIGIWELPIYTAPLSLLSASGCCAGPPLAILIAPQAAELYRFLGYGWWIYMNIAISTALAARLGLTAALKPGGGALQRPRSRVEPGMRD